MRKLLYPILISTILFSGCSKSNLNEVQITGGDLRACSCCGGYFLKMNNQSYRAIEIIPNSIITSTTSFPLQCKIAFTYIDTTNNYCMSERLIKITQNEK